MPPSSMVRTKDPGRALRIMLAVAIALHALRLLAAFIPGSVTWSLDDGRFLGVNRFLVLWLVALGAATLVARTNLAGDTLARFSNRVPRWLRSYPMPFVGGALMGWLLPDRLGYLGDSLLRTASIARGTAELFPQATPGDAWWHLAVPTTLVRSVGVPAQTIVRAQGALAAGASFVVAAYVARAHARSPVARTAVFLIVAFSGVLFGCVGYSKGLQSAAVFTMLFLASVLTRLRQPRSRSIAPEAAVLGALLMHRSSLLLLPAHVLALVRQPRNDPGERLTGVRVAAALTAWAIGGGFALGSVVRFDLATAHAATSALTVAHLAALVHEPLRVIDFANALLLLAPQAALLAVAAPRVRGDERAVLTAVAVPWLLVTLFAPPPLGLFRYLDVALPLAGVLALATGVHVSKLEVGSGLRGSRAMLATALLVACFPVAVHLIANADLSAGLARLRAFDGESPRRAAVERSEISEFLGTRSAMAGLTAEAARAYGEAAELAPSFRRCLQWGLAAAQVRDWAAARRAFAEASRRDPASSLAWLGVFASATESGDLIARDSSVAVLARLVRTPRGRTELALVPREFPVLKPWLSDASTLADSARRSHPGS